MEKYSEKRRIGNIGEDIACLFLVKQGYRIQGRNYLKKWGELDIIASRSDIVHFIEVKTSVSRQVSQECFTADKLKIEVSRETDSGKNEYRPEDNVHYWKQKRMKRAIQSYIAEGRVLEDQEWQIDIITVKIDLSSKTAIINHIENVILDV